MATNEVEVQPARDPVTEVEQDEILSDDEMPYEEKELPEHEKQKSGVDNNPNARDQSGKYMKQDTVHMSIKIHGQRQKRVFTVYKSRLNKAGQYFEYQLKAQDGFLYEKGAWIRERELRQESSR